MKLSWNRYFFSCSFVARTAKEKTGFIASSCPLSDPSVRKQQTSCRERDNSCTQLIKSALIRGAKQKEKRWNHQDFPNVKVRDSNNENWFDGDWKYFVGIPDRPVGWYKKFFFVWFVAGQGLKRTTTQRKRLLEMHQNIFCNRSMLIKKQL